MKYSYNYFIAEQLTRAPPLAPGRAAGAHAPPNALILT